jgi:hypothetical protein
MLSTRALPESQNDHDDGARTDVNRRIVFLFNGSTQVSVLEFLAGQQPKEISADLNFHSRDDTLSRQRIYPTWTIRNYQLEPDAIRANFRTWLARFITDRLMIRLLSRAVHVVR